MLYTHTCTVDPEPMRETPDPDSDRTSELTRGEPVALVTGVAEHQGWVLAYGAHYDLPGWVRLDHLEQADCPDGDAWVDQTAAPYKGSPLDIARSLFLEQGTPYLWGGITPAGVDCSGLPGPGEPHPGRLAHHRLPGRPTTAVNESWDRPAGLDVSYYQERLTEPGLADLAIPVEIAPGEFEPAVPCGRSRAAGQITVLEPCLARAAVLHLTGREGFPDVRLGWAEPAGQVWSVEWGDHIAGLPDCGHFACVVDHHYIAGSLYGYTMTAVTSHIGRVSLARYGRLLGPYT